MGNLTTRAKLGSFEKRDLGPLSSNRISNRITLIPTPHQRPPPWPNPVSACLLPPQYTSTLPSHHTMSFLLTKRAIFTTAATASAAGAFYHTYSSSRPSPAVVAKKMPTAYEATFSVPLECDECVKDISSALAKLPGNEAQRCSHPQIERPQSDTILCE